MPSNSATLVALAAVLALLALRLIFIGDPAVWIDEAFSLYHAKHDLATLWGIGWELESSPPLYYTAVWAWTRLAGGDEASVRLLSLLLTGCAALFIYRAGTALGGRVAGSIAAILFAAQPLVFEFSLEIRPYALQLLFLTVAIAAFARTLMDLEHGLLRTQMDALKRVLPIVLAGSLATYTHATTPIFLAALSATAALYGLYRHQGRAYWLIWLIGNVAVLLAILAQLKVMSGVLATNRAGLEWIPSSASLRSIYDVARSMAVGQHSWGSLETKWVGGCIVVAIGWSLWRLRNYPAHLAVGVVLPALGFATFWLVSLAQPALMPRTALWLVAPLCVLVGAGLSTWRGSGRRLEFVVAVLVLSLAHMSISDSQARTRDRPWARFIAETAPEMSANDEVVTVDTELACVLDFYASESQRTVKRWVLERGPEQRYRSRQRISLGCNNLDAVSIEDVAVRLARGFDIWLLAGDSLQREDIRALLQSLPRSVRVIRRHEQRNETLVWQLTTRESTAAVD